MEDPFLVLPAAESKSPRSAPSTASPLQPPDPPSPSTDLRIDGLQSGPHSSSTGLEANDATQRPPASPPQGAPQELNHLPASKQGAVEESMPPSSDDLQPQAVPRESSPVLPSGRCLAKSPPSVAREEAGSIQCVEAAIDPATERFGLHSPTGQAVLPSIVRDLQRFFDLSADNLQGGTITHQIPNLKTSFNGQKEISVIKFVRLKPKRRSFRSTPPESIKEKKRLRLSFHRLKPPWLLAPAGAGGLLGTPKKGSNSVLQIAMEEFKLVIQITPQRLKILASQRNISAPFHYKSLGLS